MSTQLALLYLLGTLQIIYTLPLNGQFNYCSYYCGDQPKHLTQCTNAKYYNVTIDCSSYAHPCTLLMVRNSETAVEICMANADAAVAQGLNLENSRNAAIMSGEQETAGGAADDVTTEKQIDSTAMPGNEGEAESEAAEPETAAVAKEPGSVVEEPAPVAEEPEPAPMEAENPEEPVKAAEESEKSKDYQGDEPEAAPEEPKDEEAKEEEAKEEQPKDEEPKEEETEKEEEAKEEESQNDEPKEEPKEEEPKEEEPKEDSPKEEKPIPTSPPSIAVSGHSMQTKCYMCNSVLDKNCKKKPTDFIDCLPIEGKESGCFTMSKGNISDVIRGCITDMDAKDMLYCKKNEKLCAFCTKDLCNKLNAPNGAASLVGGIFALLLVCTTGQFFVNYSF